MVLSAGLDSQIILWDLDDGTDEVINTESEASVNSAVFSPDGKYVISGAKDGYVRIWDIENQRLENSYSVIDEVHSIDIDPSGRRIVSVDNLQSISIRDIRGDYSSGSSDIGSFSGGHSDTINSVSYSFDGSKIITTSSDRTFRIWDTRTGQNILTSPRHGVNIPSAVFSPSGDLIFSADWERSVHFWDAQTGAKLASFSGKHKNYLTQVAFNPNGKSAASACKDGSIRIWTIKLVN